VKADYIGGLPGGA